MSHNMARGHSGRIVIEYDPSRKAELYVELARRGLTLKAWFSGEVDRLLVEVEPVGAVGEARCVIILDGSGVVPEETL